jgi:outer membrane protein assembly factor BamD (BamD/ComL family)
MSAFPMQEKKDVLQPNEQEVDLDAVWARFRVLIYSVLGLLVLAAAGVWFYFNLQKRAEAKEIEAQKILNTAMDEQTMVSLVDQFPQTDAASQALLLLAFREYTEQTWPAMRDYYQKLYDRDSARRPDWAAAALYGIGVTYEAEQNWDKALESYSMLSKNYPNSYKAPEAMLAVARVHEWKGEHEKARQVYENVQTTYPQSEWKAKAEQRLQLIGARAAP